MTDEMPVEVVCGTGKGGVVANGVLTVAAGISAAVRDACFVEGEAEWLKEDAGEVVAVAEPEDPGTVSMYATPIVRLDTLDAANDAQAIR